MVRVPGPRLRRRRRLLLPEVAVLLLLVGFGGLALCGLVPDGTAGAAGTAGAGAMAAPVPRVVGAGELAAALAPGGRPRLVHAWATWCMPCVAGWPALAAVLRPRAGRSVEVVLVAIDDPAAATAAGRILGGAPAVAGRSLLAPARVAFAPLRRLDPEWDGALPLTLAWDARGRRLLAQRGLTRLDEIERVLDRLVVAPTAAPDPGAPAPGSTAPNIHRS